MSSRGLWFFILVAAIGGAFTHSFPNHASADNLYLDDGAVVHGGDAVVDGDRVILQVAGGHMIIPRQAVVRMEEAESDVTRFKARYAKLKSRDVAGRLSLANWCRDRDLRRREAELLKEIIELAPDHRVARQRLGFVKVADGWISQAEHNRRLGLVLVAGHWMTRQEARQARLDDARGKTAELERDKALAELKAIEARTALAKAQAKAQLRETTAAEQPATPEPPPVRFLGGYIDPTAYHVHEDVCRGRRCQDRPVRRRRSEPFWMPHVRDPRTGFPKPQVR